MAAPMPKLVSFREKRERMLRGLMYMSMRLRVRIRTGLWVWRMNVCIRVGIPFTDGVTLYL